MQAVFTESFIVELSRAESAQPHAEMLFKWQIIEPSGSTNRSPAGANSPFSLAIPALDLSAYHDRSDTGLLSLRKKLNSFVLDLLEQNNVLERLRGFANGWPQESVPLAIRFSTEEAVSQEMRAAFQIPWELVAGPLDEVGRQVGDIEKVPRRVSVVRLFEGAQNTRQPIRDQLRVLILKGHPGEANNRIDVTGECEEIKAALRGIDEELNEILQIDDEWVKSEKLGTNLGTSLAKLKPHVVVFLGHGSESSGIGRLLISREFDAGGNPTKRELLKVTDFASDVARAGSETRLVVLNACSSAGTLEAFRQGAIALVEEGIGAVVSMQGKINAQAAHEFLKTTLQELVLGEPPYAAVLTGRSEILNWERNHLKAELHGDWARPILMLNSLAPSVFDLDEQTFDLKRARRRTSVLKTLNADASLDGAGSLLRDSIVAALKNAPPVCIPVLERLKDESLHPIEAAVKRLIQPPHRQDLVYIVKMPELPQGFGAILNSLREQAVKLNDFDLKRACCDALNRSAPDVYDLISSLRREERTIVCLRCEAENAKVWGSLAELFANNKLKAGLKLRLLLAGTGVEALPAAGLAPVRLNVPPTPVNVESLRLSLRPLQWLIVEVLSLLREPVSAEGLYLILDDPGIFQALELWRETRPEPVVFNKEWSLRADAKPLVAETISEDKRREIHKKAADYFLKKITE